MTDLSSLQQVVRTRQKDAKADRVVLPFTDGAAFKISWLAPDPAVFKKFDELDDVKDELGDWLPIGKADGQCILVNTAPPHRVAVFMEKFNPLADSLDAFFGGLLAKGEKSPQQKLEQAVDKAEALTERGKPAEVVKLLSEALRPYETLPDPAREEVADEEDLLGYGFQLLGVAAHESGDDVLAMKAYTLGLAFLNFACGGNILLMHLDAKRYDEAVKLGRDVLEEWERKIPIEEELPIRGRMLAALWRKGDGGTAEAELRAWSKGANKKERGLLLGVLKDALAGAPEALARVKEVLS